MASVRRCIFEGLSLFLERLSDVPFETGLDGEAAIRFSFFLDFWGEIRPLFLGSSSKSLTNFLLRTSLRIFSGLSVYFFD